MQEDRPKCPECKGTGKLMKLWPLYAISMPHELAWQVKPCWRCKGTGKLPEDDPYLQRDYVTPPAWPRVVLLWWWLFAAANLFVILILLWP